MNFNLFGFRIGKQDDKLEQPNIPSFAPPPNDDGAAAVNEGGAFGTTVDLESTIKNETLLITKYREMAQQPECDKAIEDVINEAIISDEKESPLSIVLDDTEFSANIKKRITEEFTNILNLLNFNSRAYDIFKNWYVDGRLFYHIMIDIERPKLGIQELRYIDPRRIKKVRVQKRQKTPTNTMLPGNQVIPRRYDEYYIYTERGINNSNMGIKISPDSIAYCHSGILNSTNTLVLSYLHKAIKPLNQLRMLEDATVIYRLARAPERRIFYIDVGNLPKAKAEQYLRDMMAKHKNKLVYDANTGEVRDDRKFMTMLEDYWLPRREGGKGTEISTLPGGQHLGEIEDVVYFRKKLYESLHVPISRLESEAQFNVGKSSEITRDEIKFAKFVTRLRNRFSEIFNILLEKQLLLMGVITADEWKENKNKIRFDYIEDNHFAEMRDIEILRERLDVLTSVDPFVGKYYSRDWVKKNVCRQTEEEIEEQDDIMATEPEAVVMAQPDDGTDDLQGNSAAPEPEQPPPSSPKPRPRPTPSPPSGNKKTK
jgi:hypothetical protein